MTNTEWYFKKTLNKIDELKLRRKVIWDIICFYSVFVLGFLGLLTMLLSIFKGVYFRIDIKNTNYFWGVGIVFLMSLVLVINDSFNPLNKLNMNDKIFCWMHYLIKQIKLYKPDRQYNALQKIKLKFIIKIINKDLYTISNNLDNSFIFLKDKEKIVKKVGKLIKLFNAYIIALIDDEEAIKKLIDFLDNIERQYLLLVSNKLLYCETDISIPSTIKEIDELFNKKYDEIFNNLEILISNDIIASEPIRNLLFAKRKYFILFIWVIVGISLIYLIFKDEKLATLIGSVVGVLAALFGGVGYIMKDKGD